MYGIDTSTAATFHVGQLVKFGRPGYRAEHTLGIVVGYRSRRLSVVQLELRGRVRVRPVGTPWKVGAGCCTAATPDDLKWAGLGPAAEAIIAPYKAQWFAAGAGAPPAKPMPPPALANLGGEPAVGDELTLSHLLRAPTATMAVTVGRMYMKSFVHGSDVWYVMDLDKDAPMDAVRLADKRPRLYRWGDGSKPSTTASTTSSAPAMPSSAPAMPPASAFPADAMFCGRCHYVVAKDDGYYVVKLVNVPCGVDAAGAVRYGWKGRALPECHGSLGAARNAVEFTEQ